MATQGGLTVVGIDRLASEETRPYGIITADCTGAHELDDGIAVIPLDTDRETYLVHVFSVDTSKLYGDGRVLKSVLTKTESVYNNQQTSVEEYIPMLETPKMRRLHFGMEDIPAGTTRSALAISFIIGIDQPPTAVTLDFTQVEVLKNHNYKDFGELSRPGEELSRVSRAAALILYHLQPEHLAPDQAQRQLLEAAESPYKRGSDINQAFMVAAGHLGARTLRDEGFLAIFRVHDMSDPQYTDFLGPRLARFSSIPGPHDGLGLDVYARFTSPLRRLEDFIMLGLLRARAEGRSISSRDRRNVATAIQRLNQRTMARLFAGDLRQQDEDLWTTR